MTTTRINKNISPALVKLFSHLCLERDKLIESSSECMKTGITMYDEAFYNDMANRHLSDKVLLAEIRRVDEDIERLKEASRERLSACEWSEALSLSDKYRVKIDNITVWL